ncbi:MAG: ectonucleotide pyrophosphatase/phosphodiesterase [Bacteroidales bacterium]|nr:ectonucleotide pyrophosphatase/phosphodiesterase [Bacteroidales bacterium]
MKPIKLILALSAAAALFLSCSKGPEKDIYTVVVSLDAFRWDYTMIHKAPFLDSLGHAGVIARMAPSYPASTFPNHYTIATGLVPDHNGIVNGSFYNKADDEVFSMGDTVTRYNPAYFLGEPIWVTAANQGVPTASVYWVGSDIAGHYPTYYRCWDEKPGRLDFEGRCNEVVRLLEMDEAVRPRLVFVYFDEPDWTGHGYGPTAPETGKVVACLDSLMAGMYAKIQALDIADKVNLIVTSDHGMTDMPDERVIPVDDKIKDEWVAKAVWGNPISIFTTSPEAADSIVTAFDGVAHMAAYRHGELPANLDYGTSDRLGDVLLVPELGWSLGYAPKHPGAHGFDPAYPDMQVIFRAAGPSFKEGYDMTAGCDRANFKNIDIYPLLAKIMNIKPAKVDGSLERISPILK